MADLSTLLAELGGDSPQNRAIAEGLQKQGVSSVKNIGVKTESRPIGDSIDPDTGERSTAYAPQQVFYDKSTNQDINPTRLGIYDVKDGDKVQGNIFFHLNADDNGKISFTPQWSPRAHGFLRDNAVGKAIMSIGKIIPSPVQPLFVAAGAADALAHGKVMQAIASAVPYGIQELAQSSELLQNIAGNSEFAATAKTAAGKIAEAAGAPAYAADTVGKVALSGITAGISGGDVGAAMLKAGAGSLLGGSKDFLKTAGDFSQAGIGSLLPEGATDFDPKALSELDDSLKEVAPEGLAALQNTRLDENGLGEDLAVDTRADENGIGSLDTGGTDYSLEGGAGNDYVTPAGEGMVDDASEAESATDLGQVTVKPGWNSWEGDDNEPEIDPNAELTLPPGAEPETPELVDTGLTEPSDNVDDTGLLPKVPPIFPPKIPITTSKPPVKDIVEPVKKVVDTDILDPIIKGLVGGTVVGGIIDGLNKPSEPSVQPTDSLKGNYSFSWNPQQIKPAEKGIAYGQRYFGPHWSQQSATQPAVPSKDESMPTVEQHASGGLMGAENGGLMSLDRSVVNPNFKPTVTDNGIQASELTHQSIQHLKNGGHVIDDKTHKAIQYLASKGEPVHHIVGFMKHRMAAGGITSNALGSYSDGGHLLKGPGDGMSDDIPATIADKQPARLANEEFVIPADVVSHLGNGSSESGAKVLYDMMARVRKARTGNPKQGKQIDPHKLMPKV